MWYLIWVLGIGLALSLATLAALWGEFEHNRLARKETADAATGPEQS